MVRFTIPADAANKTYEGRLYIETTPAVGEEGVEQVGNVIKMKVPVNVTIKVTGIQILEGTVTGVTATDSEVGLPLHLQVGFTNTGNVAVQPSISIKLTRNDMTVAEIDYAETSVKVDSREIILVEWDTAGQEIGEYSAQVEVSLGGSVIDVKGLTFELLPQGTLSRQGELVGLDYEGQPAPNTITKVQAHFRNTGQVDTRAKLVAEVYRKGNLVDTLESEELLISVGREEILTAYFKPDQSGDYKVKGHVIYEGKRTEAMEISLSTDIGKGGEAEPGQSSLIILIVAAGVVILVAIAYMVLRKRIKLA